MTCVIGNCSFDNGLGHWQHKKNDVDFQWSIRNGSTPSPFTGPSAGFSGLGEMMLLLSCCSNEHIPSLILITLLSYLVTSD